jgi:hypothetical protein
MPQTKSDLLHSPFLKLERARHHIDDLGRQIDAYMAQRPFRLIAQVRHNPGKFALRVKQDKPIPKTFSLIIGYAVHNLRSALDLTMYGMANKRAPKPDRIQFPFPKSDTPKDFKSACESGQAAYAGTKVVETIRDDLRPHPQNGGAFLSKLHGLSNRDKHRLLTLSRSVPRIRPGTPEATYISGFHGGILFPADLYLSGPNDEDLLAASRNTRLSAASRRYRLPRQAPPTIISWFGRLFHFRKTCLCERKQFSEREART